MSDNIIDYENNENINRENIIDNIISGLNNVREEYKNRLTEITNIRKDLENKVKLNNDFRKRWHEIEQSRLLREYLELELKYLEKIENSYKNEADIRKRLEEIVKEEINSNISYNLIRDIADRLKL